MLFQRHTHARLLKGLSAKVGSGGLAGAASHAVVVVGTSAGTPLHTVGVVVDASVDVLLNLPRHRIVLCLRPQFRQLPDEHCR